jgi:CRP-like cAMP-binding protein
MASPHARLHVSIIDLTPNQTTAKLVYRILSLRAPCQEMAKAKPSFNAQTFLTEVGRGRSMRHHAKNDVIFSQTEPANALFYIQKGKVSLTVVSKRGRQAVIATLGTGDFFGEGCLAGQLVRMCNAAAMCDCLLVRLEKAAALTVIHDKPAFSALFLRYLLVRHIRMEGDLVNQLFNSSEKRLARVLLLLANFGKDDKPEAVIPKMSQAALAAIIGTTRAKVGFFMSRFRKMGFIGYKNGLEIHSSLLTILLQD